MRAGMALALMVAAATMPAAQAQGASGELRAAIIFNILRFVDWDQPARELRLCLTRDAPDAGILTGLHGRAVGSRRLVVRTAAGPSPAGCDAIYLGPAGAADIRLAGQRGVLVIGDGPRFIGAGGMVGLVQMGNQIRFEINNGAARRGGLQISSKLLRLASRIEQ